MVEKLLNDIKNDIKGKIKKEDINEENIFNLHFGICLYIRNKYLYKNMDLIPELEKMFNIDNIDDLSFLILNYFKNDLD